MKQKFYARNSLKNPAWETFCHEYMRTLSPGEAYRLAYPKVTNMTQAKVYGLKLMTQDCIRKRIQFLRDFNQNTLEKERVDKIRKVSSKEDMILLLDKIYLDKFQKTSDRLKAMELKAKMMPGWLVKEQKAGEGVKELSLKDMLKEIEAGGNDGQSETGSGKEATSAPGKDGKSA